MCKKVSVIIPVYNAEKYIVPCVESLLEQTLQDSEFIFINDGSKDNSRKVIETYQKLDSRILLINQENNGVSAARNRGLEIAMGEYIGFVDADDYVDKDMFEVLYNTARNGDYDMVISNFEGEMDGHIVKLKYPFPSNVTLTRDFIEQELLPYFLKSDNLNTVCNKVFRNDLIRENNIEFPKRVALGEDGIYNIRFLSKASSVIYIDYIGYHYREVDGSATRNIGEADYFSRALEVYTVELFEDYFRHLDKKRINQLRAIKLIKNVMSYVHLYFTPSNELSYRKRYEYIQNMISDNNVQEALPVFYSENYSELGRYEKFIVDMIKRKSAIGLYFATTYSRLRNK